MIKNQENNESGNLNGQHVKKNMHYQIVIFKIHKN